MAQSSMRLRLFILLCVIFDFCYSLFEDQTGKFDWNAKFLGCYSDVVFDSSENGEEFLLATSDKNAVGRINTNTGDLDWRQLNENSKFGRPQLLVKNSRVVVASDSYVRTFDINSGSFKWQYMLDYNNTVNIKFAMSDQVFVIFNGKQVRGLVGKGRLSSVWLSDIDKDTVWNHITVIDDFVYVIGALKTNKEIRVLKLDYHIGSVEKVYRQPIQDSSFSIHSCIISGNFLVCPSRTSLFATNLINPAANDSLTQIETNIGESILRLESLKLASAPSSFFIVQSSDNTFVYAAKSDSRLIQLLKLDQSDIFTLARSYRSHNNHLENGDDGENSKIEESSNYFFAVYYHAQKLLKIYDLKKQAVLTCFRINPDYLADTSSNIGDGVDAHQLAGIRRIQIVSTSATGAFQILIIRHDCRADFYEAHIQHEGDPAITNNSSIFDAVLEWIRFEALASISNVEMMDLPLSESQAQIETEFGTEHEPLWRSFFLRITSQMEQLQRSFIALSNRFSESMTLLMSRRGGPSPSAVLRHLFGYEERRTNMQRSATIFTKSERLSNRNFERDYFNLRKLIIATTLTGSIFAINSDDGEVIWSSYLGDDFLSPITDQLGNLVVPLFIQRGTSLFQYASQAAIIYKSTNSKKNGVYVFNPVTGASIKTMHMENLKQVELLPFENTEALRSLLLVFENDDVAFYPDVPTNYVPPYPVYLLFVEVYSGVIRGAIVNFGTNKLQEVWKSELGLLSSDERIVSAVAKPHTQRVHSQGKVLGDRSVLYKYANPNVIAIASADETHATMGIWLIDGVNGQVVHSTRHSRVLPPIRLVHCENWLVYTYWNDKARRTEMGIIELYEGLEQTNAKHFNSFTPLKKLIVPYMQAYVFPQGVSAMAASETEQGLTSRSLIVAMPFGGILEISRKFIDARRPLEMTPELREEMVIPYIPELPVATEDLINYNRTVHDVRGIKTSASGLESTSLVLVYGLDMFYTRVTPSGTFDILKDDFDYLLISIVMLILIVASILSKRLWRYQNLKQAWA